MFNHSQGQIRTKLEIEDFVRNFRLRHKIATDRDLIEELEEHILVGITAFIEKSRSRRDKAWTAEDLNAAIEFHKTNNLIKEKDYVCIKRTPE
jgi:hypothetical protein